MFQTTADLLFRTLTIDDCLIVASFIDSQLATIPKNFFFPPNSKIIDKSLNNQTGISHGAFDNDKLIGIRLTYFPGLDTENHGYDLNYSEEELKQVAQFHGTLVVDDRRYKGIGNHLVKINCKEIFEKSFLRILATVHPDNLNSIKMLVNNGFSNRLITNKYKNLPRIIFEKNKNV